VLRRGPCTERVAGDFTVTDITAVSSYFTYLELSIALRLQDREPCSALRAPSFALCRPMHEGNRRRVVSCSRVVSCACEVNRGKAGPLPSFRQPGNVSHTHTTTIRWGRGTRPDPFLGVDEGHRSRATAGSLAVERPPGPCPGPFLSSSP
jgi:hypothetical protein